MSSITKKQTVVALVAIAFASAMILSTIAPAVDNHMAFASKHHKHVKKVQKTSQVNDSIQRMICQSSGGISLGSGNAGLLGLGIAAGGNGGVNICLNNNDQTNANSGSQTTQP
ncbi:MAG: hypothetical protein ACTHKK_07555 [Candidatus Nitrosocosmicus sp.]